MTTSSSVAIEVKLPLNPIVKAGLPFAINAIRGFFCVKNEALLVSLSKIPKYPPDFWGGVLLMKNTAKPKT